MFNKNIGGVDLAAGKGSSSSTRPARSAVTTTRVANITFSANVVTVVFPTAPSGDCTSFTAFPKPVNAAVRAGLDTVVAHTRPAGGFSNLDAQSAIVPGHVRARPASPT